MLTASNITFRAGHKPLIADVSVSFAPAKLHLIVGPNGAGKSTLVKVLARFLHPQEGRIEYDGVEAHELTDVYLARHRAVLSQAIEVAFPLTVREVVMMGRYPHFSTHPGVHDQQIVDDVMAHFEVTEFSERDYQTLSGGERQRVNFARVLAQLWNDGSQGTSTRYLFLDEPLTFLDIRHQIDFMNKIRAFAAAPDVVTVGVVHDLNLAARFADNIVLLNEARMVAHGTPAEVFTAARIQEVFGVTPQFFPSTHAAFNLIFN